MVQKVLKFSFCHWAKNGWIEVMFYEVLSLLMDMPDACLVVFVLSFVSCVFCITLCLSPTKHFHHKDTTIFFPPFSVPPTNSQMFQKSCFVLLVVLP